jgi:hypothetical protein
MTKEVKFLKLINSCKSFCFSHKWVGERSEVAKLGRDSYFRDGINIHKSMMTRNMQVCDEWLQGMDSG